MNFKLNVIVVASAALMTGCLGGGSGGSSESATTTFNAEDMASKASPLSLKLMQSTDSRFKSINVKVTSLEVILAKDDKAAKVVLAENLGVINLLDFQNGVMLNLASMNVPVGVYIREIRLKLEEGANFVVYQDDTICQLQTPSAHTSGLKLKLPQAMQVQTGYSYNVVADFDPDKNVVIKGNGGCLLKPVIKLGSASKIAVDDPEQEEDPIEEDPETTQPIEPTEPTEPADPNAPVEGVDYILDGDSILIPQGDGTFIVVEGVDLTVVSIEEVLAFFSQP